MAKFHLTLIRPTGFAHSSCFVEVIEGLYAGLTRLGHQATGSENTIDPGAVNIILGAHLLQHDVLMELPASTVIYNLEQLGVEWLPRWYTQLASRYQIWDYTSANLAVWLAAPCVRPPRLVEVAYMPELCRIPVAPVQDIDVLFYGSVNDRRREVLKRIETSGMRLHCAYGIYGAQRDELISRSRLVLNLHLHSTELFEIVRVSYLLANSKAVVSENSPDIGCLSDAVAVSGRNEIVRVCLELLQNDAKRHQLELRGYQIFSANTLLQSLSAAVHEYR